MTTLPKGWSAEQSQWKPVGAIRVTLEQLAKALHLKEGVSVLDLFRDESDKAAFSVTLLLVGCGKQRAEGGHAAYVSLDEAIDNGDQQ